MKLRILSENNENKVTKADIIELWLEKLLRGLPVQIKRDKYDDFLMVISDGYIIAELGNWANPTTGKEWFGVDMHGIKDDFYDGINIDINDEENIDKAGKKIRNHVEKYL
jgi:hypothetical protein